MVVVKVIVKVIVKGVVGRESKVAGQVEVMADVMA